MPHIMKIKEQQTEWNHKTLWKVDGQIQNELAFDALCSKQFRNSLWLTTLPHFHLVCFAVFRTVQHLPD
jgi:hypothetical protein